MSRVGKYPIALPESVTVTLANDTATVTGKRGTQTVPLSSLVTVAVNDNQIHVTPNALQKRNRIMWGTTRANLSNAVTGVTQGFEKKLELQGVGYRAKVEQNVVILSLGFSHDVNFPMPEGIVATTEGDRRNVIVISGNDKQQVGEIASQIRALRPPEPYRGKGVKYFGETILRKEGKKK
ncbi:MAG: 50S ribosomal protein L6 [Alphaproteobacteria bacterium]|nr:50S ribosomal protein L6 [Alphaproteobacteria bacterium]